ncbi:uncharacterized protein M6B38_324895 [Iris pallida]|uniref:RING-type domain-containing protein n=1 Tax=Iris pallida TaxID=29817 RepID=A0AAX6H6S4_IRIPA|nr:uncharacterized protein M6B38_324895 [Iris pallida]
MIQALFLFFFFLFLSLSLSIPSMASSSAPQVEVATAAAAVEEEQGREEGSDGRTDVIVEVPVSEDDDGYDEEFLGHHLAYEDDLFLDLVEQEEDDDGDDDDDGGGGDPYDELWAGSEPAGHPEEEEAGTEPEADASGSPPPPPNCPICFRGLASCGPHRVCCLPCGHVYGRSCLEKWLQRCGETAGKCPQCNRNFRRMDIINLYAPVNVVPNDSQKEFSSLNENSESLKQTLAAQQDLKPRNLEEKPRIRFTTGSDRLDASSSIDATGTTEETMDRIAQLEERVVAIEAQMPRIAILEAQVAQLIDLQSEMAELRNEIVELRNKMTEMQTEMVELRNSVAEVRRMCDDMHGIEALAHVSKRRRL